MVAEANLVQPLGNARGGHLAAIVAESQWEGRRVSNWKDNLNEVASKFLMAATIVAAVATVVAAIVGVIALKVFLIHKLGVVPFVVLFT